MTKMSRRDEGSVYQRHDHPSCTPGDHRCYGHWVAAITIPGTRRKRVRYYRTKREALDGLRQLITERDAGTLGRPDLTVADWLDHWYKTTATTGVRPTTLAG